MKFYYKLFKSPDKWKTASSVKVLEKEIANLGFGVNDIIEIRRICDHTETWIENGIKTCKKCNEQLEVTSWRD